MKRNDITVGIPFYSKTLVDEFILSVDSILQQSFKPLEIHFIQDGPINSKLQAVINDYLSSHNNIIHIKLKKSNLAKALNESIKSTTTKGINNKNEI